MFFFEFYEDIINSFFSFGLKLNQIGYTLARKSVPVYLILDRYKIGYKIEL